jgi:formylglycine-generating enzyme required for sulfatase activity
MVNETDERRSIRGGCFTAVTAYCRSFHRYGEGVTRRDRYTGFRVVMEQA